MPSFADTLRVLNEMKGSGVVEDYAVSALDRAVLDDLLKRFGLEP